MHCKITRLAVENCSTRQIVLGPQLGGTRTNPASTFFTAKEGEENDYHASTSSCRVVTNALTRKGRSLALGDLR